MKNVMTFPPIICLLAIAVIPVRADPSEWQLLWQDEFTADRLDDTKWQLCPRGKSDWDDSMSDDPRLLKIKDGVLHLNGIVNDRKHRDPVPYLTAGVTSKGKFSFQYGKVQVRARFKSAQGAWPAIWMLGNQKQWPANGEIDLMEHLILSMQIGGDWVNTPGATDPAHYPAGMEIDWVRVYRK